VIGLGPEVSKLTLELFGSKPPATGRRQRVDLLTTVTDRLVARYGTPSLGNYADPVEEIFYILLSARTAEIKYLRSHRALRARFPTTADLAAASVKDIQACIADGGLANKRAGQIKGIAEALTRELGADPSSCLRTMPATEAFSFLLGLPGVAEKSALCVLMYSLGHDVFPVDVHARRIAVRLGVLPVGIEHRPAQALMPAFVPEGRSKELHVALVVHGREACQPKRADCPRCVLNDVCRHGKKEMKRLAAVAAPSPPG
jgi:endonuclease III